MTIYITECNRYDPEYIYGLFNNCVMLMMSDSIEYLLSYAEQMGYQREEVVMEVQDL